MYTHSLFHIYNPVFQAVDNLEVVCMFMTVSMHAVPLGGVENVRSFPYGPRNMVITWERLTRQQLRGDVSNQLFFADLEQVMSLQTSESHINVTQGLEPATNYTFNVSQRERLILSHVLCKCC